MNVLVLENVSDLDKEISDYLTKEHKKDEVSILYNLEDVDQSELISKLSWCDIICVQSSFDNRTQFIKFLNLIPKFKNIKEIRIIYLYNNPADNIQFLQFLNTTSDEITKGTIELLKHIRIQEILCKNIKTAEGEYFNKIETIYDIVPIYYNALNQIIWHERQPMIDKTGLRFYLNKPSGIESIKIKPIRKKNPDAGKKKILIDKKDLPTLEILIDEAKALFTYQIALIEEGKYDESNEKLIKEKQDCLNFLTKYKL